MNASCAITVVPLWLGSKVLEGAISENDLLSFSALSAILSKADVCFYYHYLMKKSLYLGEDFSDFSTIADFEENQIWISDNMDELSKTAEQFYHAIDRIGNGIEILRDKGTPLTIRAGYSYVPTLSVNRNTLIMTASVESSQSTLGEVDKILNVLSTVVPLHDLRKTKLFHRYTNELVKNAS